MNKKNTRPLWYITIILLVITVIVVGFWALLAGTILSDNEEANSTGETVEEVVETPSQTETLPEIEEETSSEDLPEPEDFVDEVVESSEVEIDNDKIRGDRETLPEDIVEHKNQIANIIIENYYDTGEVYVRPIEGVKFDRINKDNPEDVNWEVTYITKGELIWWLNEHLPTMFTDVNYQVTFNTETMTIQVRGKGETFKETNELVKVWLENMYLVSEYGLQEIPYTLLFQEII